MTKFQQLHQPTDRFINIEEQEYLFFGGTAYLGLLNNPAYIDLYKKGIDIYGLNNGTSRSNNVQLGIYYDAEVVLAERFGFKSSALFSSGYLAAQAAVKSFTIGKKVFYAPEAHPSLWLNSDKVEGDFKEWLHSVVDDINQSAETDFVIVSNTLDNLKPSYFDFSELLSIAVNRNVHLILDDSHGIGVVRNGAISIDLDFLKTKSNIEVTVLASLAKGMGTDAGIVLSGEDNIRLLKRNPIFMGASPCSPAALYALLNGEDILREEFEKLQDNILYFKQRVQHLKCLRYVDDFPVFSSSADGMYSYLTDKNVLISSFPYPLSTSPLLNRVVVSSLHMTDDLDFLSRLLNDRFS